MADQNITELPVKTSSGMTSSDYMLGIDSAEGYQMLIKDLGDYIIRNVQVNTIAGANQTLKSALDALNSNIEKRAMGSQATSIPNGADLDTFLTYGLYCSGAASISETLSHAPTTTAGFLLEVKRTSDTNTILIQEALCNNSSAQRFKRWHSNSGWTNWIEEPNRSELDALNSKTITAITPSSIPEGITLTRCDEMHVGNLTILELTMRNGDSGIENVRKTFGFNKKYGRILAMTFFGNANTSDTGYTVSLNIPTFSTYTAGTNTTNITFDFGYTDGHPMAYTNNRIHVAHCLLVFADVS